MRPEGPSRRAIGKTGEPFVITHITEEHRRVFQALTSGDYGNFALFSVFVGGEPGAAIVAVNERPPAGEGGKRGFEIRPLFVSLTPGMTVADHDGRAA